MELAQSDADGDGRATAEEQTAHFGASGQRLAENLRITDDAGRPLEVQYLSYELTNPTSQLFRFRANVPANGQAAAAGRSYRLEDRNFAHKPGVLKILTGPRLKAELPKGADLSHCDQIRLQIRVVK